MTSESLSPFPGLFKLCKFYFKQFYTFQFSKITYILNIVFLCPSLFVKLTEDKTFT
jgi:hypothetical protein